MSDTTHWDKVYRARDTNALTWHQDEPGRAFDLIVQTQAASGNAPIIDIGGGASGIAGALVGAGYGPITVLDLSSEALDRARERVGPQIAQQITWQVADVLNWAPDRTYVFWHDRAVFHFLTKPEDRATYMRALLSALRPGGQVIISTFADDGPEKCSGLPVQRYAPEELAAELKYLSDDQLEPIHAERLDHVTPLGNIQKFQLSQFRRRD